jgi:IclR family acetate operon transcriptional repressor
LATPPNLSLHRAFAVLAAFDTPDAEASATEIAARTGLAPATAHRFLATLESLGAVMRGRNGRYRLGMLLADLGNRVTPPHLLAEAAEQPLKTLAKEFRETAHLGILKEGMVTYLVKASGRRNAEVPTKVDSELEAYCSGIGKVLLAHLAPAELEAYLGEGAFVALTAHTLTDPALLRLELEKTKARGFGRDDEEVMDSLVCIAVPVFDNSGRARAAISLSGPAGHIRREDFEAKALAALQKTARMIGDKLYHVAQAGV